MDPASFAVNERRANPPEAIGDLRTKRLLRARTIDAVAKTPQPPRMNVLAVGAQICPGIGRRRYCSRNGIRVLVQAIVIAVRRNKFVSCCGKIAGELALNCGVERSVVLPDQKIVVDDETGGPPKYAQKFACAGIVIDQRVVDHEKPIARPNQAFGPK